MKLTDAKEELQKVAMFFGFPKLDADGFSSFERCSRQDIEGFSMTRTRMCELGRTDNMIENVEFYALNRMHDYIISDYAAKSYEKVIIVGSRIKPHVPSEVDDNWNVHFYWQGYRFFGYFINLDDTFYVWYPATEEWKVIATWLKMMIVG